MVFGTPLSVFVYQIRHKKKLFELDMPDGVDSIICPYLEDGERFYVTSGMNFHEIDFPTRESRLICGNVFGSCLYHDSSICLVGHDGLHLYSCESRRQYRLVFSETGSDMNQFVEPNFICVRSVWNHFIVVFEKDSHYIQMRVVDMGAHRYILRRHPLIGGPGEITRDSVVVGSSEYCSVFLVGHGSNSTYHFFLLESMDSFVSVELDDGDSVDFPYENPDPTSICFVECNDADHMFPMLIGQFSDTEIAVLQLVRIGEIALQTDVGDAFHHEEFVDFPSSGASEEEDAGPGHGQIVLVTDEAQEEEEDDETTTTHGHDVPASVAVVEEEEEDDETTTTHGHRVPAPAEAALLEARADDEEEKGGNSSRYGQRAPPPDDSEDA
jgi:hypothetical protein